jgi:hypothetical protein
MPFYIFWEKFMVIGKSFVLQTDRNPVCGIDPLLSPEELARLLGVTTNALAIWRHQGRGPKFVRISRRAVRYSKAAIEEFLNSPESGLGD